MVATKCDSTKFRLHAVAFAAHTPKAQPHEETPPERVVYPYMRWADRRAWYRVSGPFSGQAPIQR